MKEARVPLPLLGLIAGTRGAAGAGIGMLLAEKLPPERRKVVGWTLLALGALSTIPLAMEVFRRSASEPEGTGWQGQRTEPIRHPAAEITV